MNEIPPGLRLFREGMSAAARRQRQVFLAIWVMATAMVVWPIYPFFAGISPRLLGLPLGFAWVLIAMLVMFGALLWLFWLDELSGSPANEDAARKDG